MRISDCSSDVCSSDLLKSLHARQVERLACFVLECRSGRLRFDRVFLIGNFWQGRAFTPTTISGHFLELIVARQIERIALGFVGRKLQHRPLGWTSTAQREW